MECNRGKRLTFRRKEKRKNYEVIKIWGLGEEDAVVVS